jgi:alpha-L-fucosidase
MNESWGFNITDRKFKSVRELIGYLVRAAGRDANLLLNIGPRPDGTIQPEAVARLDSLGEWLRTNGASIYGTRGGPIPPRPWGVTTQRGDTVFVHLLDWSDRVVSIPAFGGRVVRASMLGSGARVGVAETEAAISLTMPAEARGEFDRIIVLETRRP